MHIIDTKIEFNIEYGNGKITFYPYETTRFNCFPSIEMKRAHAIALEQYFCDHATQKYDGWGTGKYVSTDGVKQDNKCTFTLNGMAYHFHDSELWIYPESSMKVGRF